MDSKIFDTLKSPYVLLGGAALGVFLLINKAPGGSSPTAQPIDAFPTTAVLAYNTEALNNVTKQAAIAADYGKARLDADVTKQVALLASITSADNNRTVMGTQVIQSQEGIAKAQIAGATAIQVDMQQNLARLGMAQQQTVQTAIVSNASVDVARLQAKAAAKVAKYGFLGNVAGAVSNVARTAMLA